MKSSADELRLAWLARGAILLAALCWSLGGFFGKHPIFASWPAEHRGALLGFWRAVFAGLCVVPGIRRVTWSWKLIPMAVCFGLMSGSYMWSMALTTAANAIWLQAIAPAWVLLLMWWLHKEAPSRKDVQVVLGALTGTLLILAFESQGRSWLGCLLAVFAGMCYAGVIISLKSLPNAHPCWLVFVNQCGAMVVCAFPAFLSPIQPTGWQFPWLMAFGAVQLALPYLAFTWGLKRVSGPEAASLALLEPTLLPVWVWINVGEVPSLWTVVGGLIILGALSKRYLSEIAVPDRMPA